MRPRRTAGWRPSTRSARFACSKAFLAPALILPALLAPAGAHAQEAPSTRSALSASVGVAAWHGDFGAPTDTDIWSVLFGVRYSVGGLRLSASLPRMHIKTDGTFFAGLGGTPLFVAPNITSVKRKRNGFGDLTLGASYLIANAGQSGFDIDLSGRMKVPTATDKSQLSTSKVDYSVGAEISRPLGKVTPSVAVNYRVFGDVGPWIFQNGFDLSAGATYAVSEKSALLLSYQYREAPTRFITDSHELIVGASAPLGGDRLRVTGYGSKGLSNGAADISGGISVALNL